MNNSFNNARGDALLIISFWNFLAHVLVLPFQQGFLNVFSLPALLFCFGLFKANFYVGWSFPF